MDPDMDTVERDPSAATSRRILRRVAYWSPVGICMVLFAQVAFRGLRPAWCERGRLIEAEAMLDARHARDLALRAEIQRSLRARNDPIFLERQRRMRLHAPLLAQK